MMKEEDYPYEACKDSEDCMYLSDTGDCLFHEIKPNVVAVDLDNTLVKYDEWNGHNSFGEGLENAKRMLELVHERINRLVVVLHTTRNKEYADLKEILKDIGVYKYLHFINRNPFEPPDISPCKMYADVYVDDRAVHFDEDTDPDEAVDKIVGIVERG